MRALVSIFAGLLIVISLYQLSFTWFVNKHESAMTQKAERFIKNNYPAADVNIREIKKPRFCIRIV